MLETHLRYIRSIHETYPDFEIAHCDLNQRGQFNDILLVNDRTIFRFPKTAREAEKLATEIALLKTLQSLVPLPIPRPLYQSKEGTVIGQIFMGYPLLPGEPLWPEKLCAFNNEQLRYVAHQLATFLQRLHGISPEMLEVKLPAAQGCEAWSDLYERFRLKLFPFMRPDARLQVTQQFEAFLGDARNCSYTPALIHGDLGPSNILYNLQTMTVSGIIDFSSVAWGDPAIDFAALLGPISYGEQFLAHFVDIYPASASLLARARFYAGTFALQEALYGVEDEDTGAFERGIAGYR